MISREDYVAKGGLVCPVCESCNIEGMDGDFDGPEATCDAMCNDCGATWTDVYKLQSYRSLTDKDGNSI